MATQVDIEQETDRLYGLPLAQFTAARNALARQLEKDGQPEAAAQVGKLEKPALTAWAVNQLARRERMNVRALLEAGDALEKAERELLSGGAPARLHEAGERQAKVVAILQRAAGKVLAGAGHPATATTLDRIGKTLRAAAVDKPGGELLKRGRLTKDLDPTGFGALLGGSGSALPRAKPRGQTSNREEVTRMKERISQLRGDLSEERKRMRGTERRAAEARLRAEKEEREAEEQRARLDAAEAALANAERELARARGRKR